MNPPSATYSHTAIDEKLETVDILINNMGNVGGPTQRHMRLLSAPPKAYTNSALWSLATVAFCRVFSSFSIYCLFAVSALRQRQELGRGQSFLCHTRFVW